MVVDSLHKHKALMSKMPRPSPTMTPWNKSKESKACTRTGSLIRLELVGVAALLVPLLLGVPAVLLLPVPLLLLSCRRAQAPAHTDLSCSLLPAPL